MCGGTCPLAVAPDKLVGLSPRVRGNHGEKRLSTRVDGSIPACAGEPFDLLKSRGNNKVYPRVCGGTPSAASTAPGAIGLSPRVRGNPSGDNTGCSRKGSIPACAGEPSPIPPPRLPTPVYPRVCGGTRVRDGAGGAEGGLSPRVRGNQISFQPLKAN